MTRIWKDWRRSEFGRFGTERFCNNDTTTVPDVRLRKHVAKRLALCQTGSNFFRVASRARHGHIEIYDNKHKNSCTVCDGARLRDITSLPTVKI